MNFSTKTRYGLRILIQLGEHYGENVALKGKDIAQEQKFTEAYLEQIMIKLKEAKLVRTERGCNGGYFLAKPPETITILDVVELFEGKLTLVDCEQNDVPCPQMRSCRATKVWRNISTIFRREMAKFSLRKVIDMNKQEPDYVI
jgi:Rrf2 family protein